LISSTDRGVASLGGMHVRNRKLQEIVRINEAEDYAHEKRKSPPRGVVHYDRSDKFILHATSLKLAASSGQYIPDPTAISAIGERDQESVRLSENVDRGPVGPS
jgi:hypothetical protein